jgi:hypothetical protein
MLKLKQVQHAAAQPGQPFLKGGKTAIWIQEK